MDTAPARPGSGEPASTSRRRLADRLLLHAPVLATDQIPGPGTAYLAGEARTIQALRSHLTGDRGWPRHAIITKPFWTPAKKGME